MKKLLILVAMAMMALCANAQIVIDEQDYTGGFQGDYPYWYGYGDEQQGSVESNPDGVAIIVGSKTGELWQPQVIVLEGFTLQQDHSYKVIITAKFPSDGKLQVNMGSWSFNSQHSKDVVSTGDFQEVEFDFPESYTYVNGDGHVALHCGDFLGTTILKKVQLIDNGAKWSVIGNFEPQIIWSIDHDMAIDKNGLYFARIAGLPQGDYEFKIRADHDWSENYGLNGQKDGVNCRVSVENYSSTLTVFFDSSTHEITWTVVSCDEPLADGQTLVAEQDWTNYNGDYPYWYDLGENAGTNMAMGANGVGIYNQINRANLYPPSIHLLEGLTLKKNHSYIVRIIANVPSDGIIELSLGSLSDYDQTRLNLSAYDNYQVIDYEFPRFAYDLDATGSVSLHLGGITGYTTIQKVQVIDLTGTGVSENKKRTIHLSAAGTLPDLISEKEKYEIEELTLSGDINGTDIHFLRDMAGTNLDNMETEFMPVYGTATNGVLKVLDLSDANIVEGGRDYYRMLTSSNERTIDRKYTSANTISDCMFAGFRTLEELILPSSVTNIINPLADIYAMKPIQMNLKVLKVANGNPKYDSPNNCNAIIDTNEGLLVAGCAGTKIPARVTVISAYAFYGFSSLTSMDIPDGVTFIGMSSFAGCTGLKSITIPQGVTYIAQSAFFNCTGLTSINIPESVAIINEKAFNGCSGLTSVTVEKENPPFIANENADNVFSNPENMMLYVPKGCAATYADANCWKLFNIKEFTRDGEMQYSIEGDNSVAATSTNNATEKDVVIPESVTIDGVSYPVTSISEYAFKNNTELTLVSIPETIIEIGESAFAGCIRLTAIYCYADEPIALGNAKVRTRAQSDDLSASTVFANVDLASCTLYVPKGAAEKYSAANGWNEFQNIVEIESNEPGDANNDGKVDNKDINATVDYILEGKTKDFIFKNADVIIDSKINAADIVKIVNLKK